MRTWSGIMVLVVMCLAGSAQADELVDGMIGNEGLDVWNAQCKSPKTHCMLAYFCDDNETANEVWTMAMTLYSPSTLLGRGGVIKEGGGSCFSQGLLLCRPGAGIGPMKALIAVTRVGNTSPATRYEIFFACSDKNLLGLPDASDTLTRTTHIE